MSNKAPGRIRPRIVARWGMLALLLPLLNGCVLLPGQRYRHFTVSTPLPAKSTLIIGLLGGRDSWDDPRPGVARLAARLRASDLAWVHIETVENQRRHLAQELILNAFDQDQSRSLEAYEKAAVRVILYGQSFGGAAVVKLAGELNQDGIPVLLTVQVDSVGRGDGLIPPNVSCAANLFQDDGLIIQGEKEIRALEPSRTKIIGNFEFDYSQREIDISHVHWFKKLFRVAHTKMDWDPEVWSQVEQLILDTLHHGCP